MALAAALGVALALGLGVPALADPFAELPARHWSYDALGGLVPPGLVNPSALALYRSRPGVMRFELGLLVAQALRTMAGPETAPAATPVPDLDKLIGSYQVPVAPGRTRPLSAAEAQTLRRLVAEFAPELELLGLPVGPVAAARPLDLPTSAGGPFVDLETLTTVSQQPGTEVAVMAPVGVLAGAAAPVAGGSTLAPAGTPAPLTLPQTALSRPGAVSGPFPGQVATEQQPGHAALPSPKPALSVSAEVKPGETRLPVPKLDLSVTPTVRVSGSVATADRTGLGPGSVQVEATVAVAGVELGANVKDVQAVSPGVDPTLAQALKVGVVPDSQGYGLSLRLGQVALTAGFAEVKRSDLTSVEKRHSVEVGYNLGDTAVVRAGYQLVDLDAIPGTKPRTDASVGVNVNLSRSASVSAGVTLEGMRSGWPLSRTGGQRASAGVELRLPWNTFLTAGYEQYRSSTQAPESRPQSAATVGVGYNFAAHGTLLVGYRLIDFGASSATPDTTRQQNLTAGVSLSF